MPEYPTREEVYLYLENIRKMGIINMFDSPVMLMRDYGLPRQRAIDLFLDWSRERESIQKGEAK